MMDNMCYGCGKKNTKVSVIKDQNTVNAYGYLISKETDKLQAPSISELKLCIHCTSLLQKFIKFRKKAQEIYYLFKKNEVLALENQNNTTEINLNIDNLENVQNTSTIAEDLKPEIYDKISPLDNKSDAILNSTDEEELSLSKLKTKPKRKKKKSKFKYYKEIVLNDIEISEMRKKMALQEEYINAIYKCIDCQLALPNNEMLNEHRRIKHNLSYPHKCNICNRKFSNESTLAYHIKVHRVRYECRKCGHRSTSKNKGDIHYMNNHATKVYSCEKCGKNFLSYNKHSDHSITCGNNDTCKSKPIQCNLCEKTFIWRASLRKHMATHKAREAPPSCQLCEKSFTNEQALIRHMKTSSQHLAKLKMKTSKTTDIPTPKERNKYACTVCARTFQWKGNLTRHYQSHLASAAGRLTCVPCERTFSSEATYRTHLTSSLRHVHTDDYKYTCDHCNKKYPDKCRLRDHINFEHMKKYTHVCSTCGKPFKTGTSLQIHTMTVHDTAGGDKLCHHCGKAFKSPATLRCHLVTHAQDKQHKCPVCSKMFKRQPCLKRHLKCHNVKTVNS